MITTRVLKTALAAFALAASGMGQAQTPTPASAPPAPAAAPAPVPLPPNPARDALYIKSLAATCANCHGTDGKALSGSSVVTLAGMPKDYIVAQMATFKSGTRPATIMHQLAKGYSDDQIKAIAGYFAEQKK